MNSNQDQVTPEGGAMAGNSNLFPTPQSVMDEIQHNRKPGSSGKSPRQEMLVRRKMQSEERFRALVDSIQKADAVSQSSTHDTSSRKVQSENIEQERKRKKHKKSKKGSHHTTTSAASESVTSTSRRKQESTSTSRREVLHKDSPDTPDSGPWGIKSVVSDNMDNWMDFHDDTDFSESNQESHDNSSKMSSEVDYLTQSSLLELTPRTTKLDDSTPSQHTHASLGNSLLMESETSHASRSSSQRRPKSKKSSSRRREGDHKRSGMSQSRSSSRSIDPTPSVIAAGVQHVAAKFDVDMSPTRSDETDLMFSTLASDTDSQELLKKAAAESRHLRSRNRSRPSMTPEGIELVTDEDHESMSTVSYDPVLDLISSSKANAQAIKGHIDASDEFKKVSPTPSDYDRQRMLSEVLKSKWASQVSEKQKAVASNSLADVLEGSREGDLTVTEDESPDVGSSPSQLPNTIPPLVSGDPIVFSTDPTDFYRKKDVSTNRFESVEVRYQQMDSERVMAGLGADDSAPETEGLSAGGCKTLTPSCSRLIRNPYFLGLGSLVLLGLVALVVVLLVTRQKGTDEGSASALSDDELLQMIATDVSIDKLLLLDVESYQGKAFAWIKGADRTIRSDREAILQRFALATLFFGAKGEKWDENNGWLSGDDECTWFSSSADSPCDENGNLISLSLRSNNLVGELPAEIAVLRSLRSIDLSGNSLFGSLPTSLELLVDLSSMNLDSNAFDRNFPELLTRLTNLRVLSLSLNRFTGLLPSSISNLTNMEVFSVAANRLTSGIPSDISKMTALRELYLEFNELSGPIVSELGLLSNLENIKLDLNLFSSGIPTELGLLVNLRSFSCNDCSLVGGLPTETGQLVRLNTFELQSNELTGTIPSEIGLATSLRLVDLSYNSFAGTLPSDVGRLASISIFDASGNKLTGTLPRELASIDSKGFVFYLDNNQLTGTIPEEVCNLLVESRDVISLNGTQVVLCNCEQCHTGSQRSRGD